MNTKSSTLKSCPKCQLSLPEGAINFCPQCGNKLNKNVAFSIKLLAFALVIGGALAWIGWSFQGNLVGTAPTAKYNPTVHSESFQYEDPDIQRIRAAIQTNPDDLSLWISLTRALLERVKSGVISRDQGLSDAIDALGHILSVDPEQTEALILMADLSFDQQAFTKAKEFYERYLEIEDKDDDIWARYASTLNFLGQSEQAAKILTEITQRDPDHFQALAFLAITHAQMGDQARALELAERALPNAPSEEAKKRFQGFIQSLQSENSTQQASSTLVESTEKAENSPTFESSYKIMEYISQHSIAGPKLAHFETEGDILKVYLKEFPMEQMPEFAKQKFLAPIKEVLVDSPLKAVDLIDQESGKTMEQVTPD